MGTLQGRIAIVTGGARGIGAATALRLANEGAKVAVFDLNEEAANKVVRDIKETGSDAIALAVNVSIRDEVEKGIETVVNTFDKIDILVNNAGIIRDNLVYKMSDDDWDQVMNVHLKGSFLCSQIAQKYMVKQKYGKIIMVSSRAALGNRGQVNYSSAKAGLQGLAKTLAIELGPFGINVNAVAPGFVETEMTRATAERMGIDFEKMKQDFEKSNPIRRVGKPEDVANVISFLSSDDSSYLTGQVIYVTGRPVI